MQNTSTQKPVGASSPAPVTPAGPRRSQRVVQQPERTLSSYKNTPTYASNKPSNPLVSQSPLVTASASSTGGNPVPAYPQAQTSNYVSRLRTGSTLLMQPVSTVSHTAAAASAALTALAAPRRRGGVVNYAEGFSDDDFGDPSEEDEEFSGRAGSSKRSTPRIGGTSSFRVGSPSSSTPQRESKMELDKSYLGLIPPSRYFTSKAVSKSRHDYPTPEELIKIAKAKEVLIPIRIDLDTETHRIRDCFTWNLNEEFITPETFARIFCQDLELPPVPYVDQVSGAIRAQIEEHAVVASFDLEGDNGAESELESSGETEAHRPLKHDRITALSRRSRTATPGHDSSRRGDTEPPDEADQVDCRVLLSLDVQINKYHLLDTIEWDLAPTPIASTPPVPPTLSQSSTPTNTLPPCTTESFARILCADIGLHGEAVPIVAHAIHEEILKHKKDAIEWGVLAAEPMSARQRARNPFGPGPRAMRGVWRDWNEVGEFGPRLEIMSQEELERRELERERIARRLRRDTSKYVKAAGGRKRR